MRETLMYEKNLNQLPPVLTPTGIESTGNLVVHETTFQPIEPDPFI